MGIKKGDRVVMRNENAKGTGMVGTVVYINSRHSQPWAVVDFGHYRASVFCDEALRCADTLKNGQFVFV